MVHISFHQHMYNRGILRMDMMFYIVVLSWTLLRLFVFIHDPCPFGLPEILTEAHTSPSKGLTLGASASQGDKAGV